MATDFVLPDIGEGLTEAEIIRWLVAEGETVELDQPIVEIETDKALMEIPTPFAGVIVSHGAPEGTVLGVGQVLVSIETETDAAGAAEEPSGRTSDAAPIVGTLSSEAVDLEPRRAAPRSGTDPSSVRALPIVRRLANDLGVDLLNVTGTGAAGGITRDDVRAAAESRDPSNAETPSHERSEAIEHRTLEETLPESEPLEEEPVDPAYAVEVEEDVEVDEPIEIEAGEPLSVDETIEDEQWASPEMPDSSAPTGSREPMSRLRRTIAERVTASWAEIPHVTTFGSADVTRLLASRSALKRRREAQISIDAMVVKAVASALDQHAVMAARIDGEELVYPDRVDVGVAVDTEDGLVIVVVEHPLAMDIVELSESIATLSERARDRTLGPGAFTGQSFTVSNIGAVGGGYGTPIVPHGTTGILSIGRAVDTPVARGGKVGVAPMMPLSLSYDHRVIDGAAGRRFLATIVENLEEPTLFLA